MKPRISVVMSVYNAEKYVRDSIESILNQTYSDFEFIIIEDCSEDKTLEIIESYSDNRIKLIKKVRNKGFKGFVENLNIGLDESRGDFIARMDADDIASLDRFDKQVKFLNNNPSIFMVGSSMNLIDENNNFIKKKYALNNHSDIVNRFNIDNPMFHPTLMFRKTDIRYNDNYKGAEDFDFHLQHLSIKKKFANIDECLLNYRVLDDSLSRIDNKLINRIILEFSRDQFVMRKENKSELDYNLEKLVNYRTENLSLKEKIYILKIALKYNSSEYKDLLKIFNVKSLRLLIFENENIRNIASKFLLKRIQKIK
ncbi:glycosyltransferase [Empedobacter sp. GD03861]|uniref:glycosyltransferase family 2 protein n=1 Tax=Empedobacter sp. GD03861 TaxID=2975390 RepID=UPI00244B1630|nr:glycosyltransferase [Empedobacter sp. GD03861]MDH0673325.1 glycosyltransferase [Empedobacter sp. GD03861]